jgi:hypothetical protein
VTCSQQPTSRRRLCEFELDRGQTLGGQSNRVVWTAEGLQHGLLVRIVGASVASSSGESSWRKDFVAGRAAEAVDELAWTLSNIVLSTLTVALRSLVRFSFVKRRSLCAVNVNVVIDKIHADPPGAAVVKHKKHGQDEIMMELDSSILGPRYR